MLTGGVAQRHRPLALRSANTLAATSTSRMSATCPGDRTDDDGCRGRHCRSPAGLRARGLRDGFGSVRHEGALLCVAVGAPRFDSRVAPKRRIATAPLQDGSKPIASAARKCSRWRTAHGRSCSLDLAQKRVIAAVDRFAMRQLCFRADGRRHLVREPRRRSARRLRRDRSAGDLRLCLSSLHSGAAHDLQGRRPSRRRASGRRDRERPSAWSATGSRVSLSSTLPFAERKELFLRALTGAVSDQLAGESIGCYLSGGTDSSTVAGHGDSRSRVQPVKTFSIGFDAAGYDEMEYARIAARRFRTDHHEYYITPDDLDRAHSVRRIVVRSAVRQLVGAAGVLLRQARSRRGCHADARRRRRRRALRRQLALRERQAVHRLRACPRLS